MASISAVIVPAKALSGGRHKIRVSVAHNGQTRYILTDIIVDSEKEFKNGTIVKRGDAAFLNTKLRGLLQNYQEILMDMEYKDGLTCSELVELIKETKCRKNVTLEFAFKELIETSRASESTITAYSMIWNTLSRYVKPNTQLSKINHATVLHLEKSLRTRKLSNSTIWHYMNVFSLIISYAKKCGYVEYRIDPFAAYKRVKPEVRDNWITPEQVRTIRDLDVKKKNLVQCRDLFMLSYYLGGINVTDLLDIDFNENKDTLEYERKKTRNLPKINKTVRFDIPEEAKAIIEKYIGKDGRLAMSESQRRLKMNTFWRYNLRLISELTGIDNLIYYTARKSFSQHAYELGINTAVIDYILGHKIDKDGSSLFHYIYVTPEMATEAIRKVIDNLK